jgi:hypothetical protein
MLRRMPGARVVALAIAIPAMAAGSPGCESPTLPLPPPVAPTIAPGADANHVKLVSTCGGAEPNAVIVIVNSNPTVPPDEAVGGSISNGCGAWDAVVYAHVGDYLEITQEYGTTRSTPVDVQVLTP